MGGAQAVWEVGGGLHILVASSSEHLLLLIKWRGLRGGDTAATVRFSPGGQEMRSGIDCLQVKSDQLHWTHNFSTSCDKA